MAICDHCGNQVKFLYTCKYCRKKFCKDHKLPEDHDCEYLEKIFEFQSEINDEQEVYEESSRELFEDTKIHIELESEEPEHHLPSFYEAQLKKEVDEFKEPPISISMDKDYDAYEGHFLEEIEESKIDEVSPIISDREETKIEKVIEDVSLPEKKIILWGNITLSSKQLQIMLVVLVIASTAMNGFLYIEYDKSKDQSRNLQGEYTELYNLSTSYQEYYVNLSSQYSELKQEYDVLDTLYSDLVETNSNLEKEYRDIMNYNKELNIILEKTITLLPKENYSEVYEIPFSGFITLNYNATGETYSWIGSSSIPEVFFSRNPQFPNTASEYNFTVPVLPDLVVYFANPDEFDPIEITYWINFTY